MLCISFIKIRMFIYVTTQLRTTNQQFSYYPIETFGDFMLLKTIISFYITDMINLPHKDIVYLSIKSSTDAHVCFNRIQLISSDII